MTNLQVLYAQIYLSPLLSFMQFDKYNVRKWYTLFELKMYKAKMEDNRTYVTKTTSYTIYVFLAFL
jgi:hypothetical protein